MDAYSVKLLENHDRKNPVVYETSSKEDAVKFAKGWWKRLDEKDREHCSIEVIKDKVFEIEKTIWSTDFVVNVDSQTFYSLDDFLNFQNSHDSKLKIFLCKPKTIGDVVAFNEISLCHMTEDDFPKDLRSGITVYWVKEK